MLVLSRKKNESLVINNDIIVEVVEIRADKVRLGVEVPKEVPVHRREVHDAIHGHQLTPSPPGAARSGGVTPELASIEAHVPETVLSHHARFVLGATGANIQSNALLHLQSCAQCRAALCRAIAAYGAQTA